MFDPVSSLYLASTLSNESPNGGFQWDIEVKVFYHVLKIFVNVCYFPRFYVYNTVLLLFNFFLLFSCYWFFFIFLLCLFLFHLCSKPTNVWFLLEHNQRTPPINTNPNTMIYFSSENWAAVCIYTVGHKKRATLFWTITSTFLDRFQHFVYQRKKE